MKHDYEAALKAFKEWVECDLVGVRLCFYADTITNALKLAAKLEQKPSEGMITEITLGGDYCRLEVIVIFKAMLDQARKEI